jgi:hypothetical protein
MIEGAGWQKTRISEKIPLIFYRLQSGGEPVRDLAETVAETGAPRYRKRSVASAVAVAGGHADVPPAGERFMGDPDEPADEMDGARAALFLSRAPRRAAWIYQENPRDAG